MRVGEESPFLRAGRGRQVLLERPRGLSSSDTQTDHGSDRTYDRLANAERMPRRSANKLVPSCQGRVRLVPGALHSTDTNLEPDDSPPGIDVCSAERSPVAPFALARDRIADIEGANYRSPLAVADGPVFDPTLVFAYGLARDRIADVEGANDRSTLAVADGPAFDPTLVFA